MIYIEVGDLLQNVTRGNILHGCNAQGVMGSGFAKSIKDHYPSVYANYKNIHTSVGLDLGRAYPVPVNGSLCVWNLITQNYYGTLHKWFDYSLLRDSLKHFLHLNHNNEQIHMPLIGCGLAKGKIELAIPIICDIMCEQGKDATIWVLDHNTANTVKQYI